MSCNNCSYWRKSWKRRKSGMEHYPHKFRPSVIIPLYRSWAIYSWEFCQENYCNETSSYLILKQTLWRHFSTDFYIIGIYGKLRTRTISLTWSAQYKIRFYNIEIISKFQKNCLFINCVLCDKHSFSLSYLLSKDRQSFLKTLLVSWFVFIFVIGGCYICSFVIFSSLETRQFSSNLIQNNCA